jgi:serine/threonine protein kinase
VHPNIVKYVDLVRSKNSLHVVLEYMENGSLRSLCDKFDGFSESLVAIYVTQVLTGLIFLHSQGVLHRDVKGANILTTKDGFVKVRGGTGRSARVQERCPARRQRARAGHSSSAWLARAASLARAAPRRRLARAASAASLCAGCVASAAPEPAPFPSPLPSPLLPRRSAPPPLSSVRSRRCVLRPLREKNRLALPVISSYWRPSSSVISTNPPLTPPPLPLPPPPGTTPCAILLAPALHPTVPSRPASFGAKRTAASAVPTVPGSHSTDAISVL